MATAGRRKGGPCQTTSDACGITPSVGDELGTSIGNYLFYTIRGDCFPSQGEQLDAQKQKQDAQKLEHNTFERIADNNNL